MTSLLVLAVAAGVLLALRGARSRTQSVPLALPEGAHTRTEACVLVAVGTLLLLGCLVGIRADRGEATGTPTASGTTVVAVDVSSSVSWNAKAQVGAALRAVARRAGDRVGLVVFADSAAVVLPPTTPAVELARVARFFPSRQASAQGASLSFVDVDYASSTPWAGAFFGGTAIARGLEAAGKLLVRAGVPRGSGGRIVLLSDLEDWTPRVDLERTMARLRRAGIEVVAVPLQAKPASRMLFRSLGAVLVPRPESLASDPVRAHASSANRDAASAPFLAVCTLLFAAVLVALHEWSSPLRLGSSTGGVS